MNNLTVNVSLIDDRGVWLNSDNLTNTTNELTPTMLSQKYGLDVTNANDYALLQSPISSPNVAARGFHGAVFHLPVRRLLGSGTAAVPAIRRHRGYVRARW